MSKFFGALLVLIGIGIAAYVGLWWAFIGGIMEIVHEVKQYETDMGNVILGVLRVMFAGTIGGFCGMWFIAAGGAMMED